MPRSKQTNKVIIIILLTQIWVANNSIQFSNNNNNNNSLVSTVIRIQTERPDNRVSIPDKSRLFLQYRVETGSGAKAAPYAMEPESLSLWGKAAGA
jgi:hypothetical protein